MSVTKLIWVGQLLGYFPVHMITFRTFFEFWIICNIIYEHRFNVNAVLYFIFGLKIWNLQLFLLKMYSDITLFNVKTGKWSSYQKKRKKSLKSLFGTIRVQKNADQMVGPNAFFTSPKLPPLQKVWTPPGKDLPLCLVCSQFLTYLPLNTCSTKTYSQDLPPCLENKHLNHQGGAANLAGKLFSIDWYTEIHNLITDGINEPQECKQGGFRRD